MVESLCVHDKPEGAMALHLWLLSSSPLGRLAVYVYEIIVGRLLCLAFDEWDMKQFSLPFIFFEAEMTELLFGSEQEGNSK
ncbi:unnamed protein product, partial [Trichogramma brassicae]